MLVVILVRMMVNYLEKKFEIGLGIIRYSKYFK